MAKRFAAGSPQHGARSSSSLAHRAGRDFMSLRVRLRLLLAQTCRWWKSRPVCTENLRSLAQFSGPGSIRSHAILGRDFITTTSGFRFSVQTAIPSDTAQQGIEQVFHNHNFDIPVGVAREESDGVIHSDYTMLTTGEWMDTTSWPPHRKGAVRAPRDLLPRRKHGRGGVRIDDDKYRFIDQPAGWLGEKTHSGCSLYHQPAARSVRAHRLAEQRNEGRRAAVL